MGVSKSYTLYSTVWGTNSIGGITNQSENITNTVMADPQGGDLIPSFIALGGQQHDISLTTTSIQDALDALGATFAVDISGLTGGCKLYFQQRAEGSAFTSGSNHRLDTINEGIIYPTSLSCSHQGDAELQVSILPTYDGTNDPIVTALSSALGTAGASLDRFTLGSATVGNIAFNQITNLQIDFGLDVVAQGADSDVWNTFASVKRMAPKITLTGTNIEKFGDSSFPIDGLAATQANTTIYLRKRAQQGTFVADGTEEHIKINSWGLATVTDAGSASLDDDSASMTIELTCGFDATNMPLVFDTTSAISQEET